MTTELTFENFHQRVAKARLRERMEQDLITHADDLPNT